MRKTSFGLGLAGTIIAFITALIMLVAAIGFSVFSSIDFDNFRFMDKMGIEIEKDIDDLYFQEEGDSAYIENDGKKYCYQKDGEVYSFRMKDFEGQMGNRFFSRFDSDFGVMSKIMMRMLSGWLWFATAVMFVAGALGVVGTVITRRKKSTTAGVLLLVSALLSLSNILVAGLFIASGVLAFNKDKSEIEQEKA